MDTFYNYLATDYGRVVADDVRASGKLNPDSPTFYGDAMAILRSVLIKRTQDTTYCGPTNSRGHIEDLIPPRAQVENVS